MNNRTYTYKVGTEIAPALIDGDTSALDASDEFAIQSFMDEVFGLLEEGDYFHWEVVEKEPYFSKCEATRKYDMCYDMTLNIRNYKSPEVIDSQLLEN